MGIINYRICKSMDYKFDTLFMGGIQVFFVLFIQYSFENEFLLRFPSYFILH